MHKLGMQKVKSFGQVLKNLGMQKPPRRYATDCEDVSVVVRSAKCTRLWSMERLDAAAVSAGLVVAGAGDVVT